MPPRLAGLTKLTLETAPTVCHTCIWWQSRGRRTVDKDRWMEKVELELDLLHPAVLVDGAAAARLPPDARVTDSRRRLERQLRQTREARRHPVLLSLHVVDDDMNGIRT